MLCRPQGFLLCLLYGFHLNFLCGHATKHGSLFLWGHSFYVNLMLHERCVVNLLQNFFCCKKTHLPNKKLDADVHWVLIFTKDLRDERKDVFKT